MTARASLYRGADFVVRCGSAAAMSYFLAQAVNLPEPLWASMSAIIVSQERLSDTRSSIQGRIAGTIIGAIVVVAVNRAASPFAVPLIAQLAIAVSICAAAALEYPLIRVCMWTCPIVLLTASAAEPIGTVALHRAGEVILGGLLGGALHVATEPVLAWFGKSQHSQVPSGKG
jgi:uncharacterized membrane protein YccC